MIENNRWTQCGGQGLLVTGDRFTIRKNTMTSGMHESPGVWAQSSSAAGGGVIEDNRITDTAERGFRISCNNATIRRNRITNAGTGIDESCCVVSGSGNTISDNVVSGGGTHGFDVSGANNTLTRCTSKDSAADGFHVTGAGNTLKDCKASLNSGEGLDNQGANTTVTGCTFTDNRIDVANGGTFTNNATFAADNKFKTGGTTTAQQID